MKIITILLTFISFSAFAVEDAGETSPVSKKISKSNAKSNTDSSDKSSKLASVASTISTPELSITDLVVPLYESIMVADYSKLNCKIIDSGQKKCKPTTSKLDKGSKIRIIEKDEKGNYKIEAFSDNGESKGIFTTSRKYADKALNWNAVSHTLDLLNATSSSGSIEDVNCKYGIHLLTQMKPIQVLEESKEVYNNDQIQKLVVRYSSNADGSGSPRTSVRPVARPADLQTTGGNAQLTSHPEENLPPYNGEYLPGCEALKKEKIEEESRDDLLKCVQSMRLTIAVGARNADGSLNRELLYANMFKKLNPKEQAFAGKVFTSIGEVESLNNKGDYMSIIKVLGNRARFARQRSKDNKYNELDVALSEWQFSMYNANEPGWRKILDPGKAISSNTLNGIMDALITVDSTDTSKYDNVYMYHANYVTPKDWDFNLLSEPFGMDFGDGNATKTSGRAYHMFYTPSDGMKGVYVGNYRKRRRDAN